MLISLIPKMVVCAAQQRPAVIGVALDGGFVAERARRDTVAGGKEDHQRGEEDGDEHDECRRVVDRGVHAIDAGMRL